VRLDSQILRMKGQKTQPIGVLLVDDKALFRAGLVALFEREADVQIVADCGNIDEARQLADSERPDIILLDLEFGLEALSVLQDAAPNAAVIALVTCLHEPLYEAVMFGGARGMVNKAQSAEILFKAVKCVHAGELWADRLAIGRLVNGIRAIASVSPGSEACLTQREIVIIRLICQGLDSGRISTTLHISPKTVRNHLSSVFQKLGVSSRLDLAIYAFRYELAPLPKRAS